MASCFNYAPINVKPEGGMWARGGDFDVFPKKMSNSPLPGKHDWSNNIK